MYTILYGKNGSNSLRLCVLCARVRVFVRPCLMAIPMQSTVNQQDEASHIAKVHWITGIVWNAMCCVLVHTVSRHTAAAAITAKDRQMCTMPWSVCVVIPPHILVRISWALNCMSICVTLMCTVRVHLSSMLFYSLRFGAAINRWWPDVARIYACVRCTVRMVLTSSAQLMLTLTSVSSSSSPPSHILTLETAIVYTAYCICCTFSIIT